VPCLYPPAMALREYATHFELASERPSAAPASTPVADGMRFTSLTRQDFGGTTEIQKEIIARSLGLLV